jgi:hypothetical protein
MFFALALPMPPSSSPSFTKKKNHTERCGFFLVDDIGLDLHFRPGMGENYCVAAVQPAASGARPRRI